MRRAGLLLLVVVALAWPAPARADEPTVDVVKLSGAIDRPVLGYVDDALRAAEAAGHTVVLQLDSAGTLDQDPLQVAEGVFRARVPVIVWVGPAPAKASGAALLLMYASSLAAVAPGSQTGPLAPLDLARPDLRIDGLDATIRGWLDARHKSSDTSWVDRPLTAAEARHRDIAQVTAVSIPDLLDGIDGRTVWTAAGSRVLRTALPQGPAVATPPVTWRFTDLGPVRRVLHAMASPSAIYLLLVLGFAALAFELTQPGFGFAGASGVGMLVLAVYGLTVVPFSWAGAAVLLAGVGSLVLDVQLRRLGPYTAVGLALFVVGSVLLFGSVSSQIDLSPWLIGSLTVGTLLYYGFALTVALQSRDRITRAQRGLVGLVGEARGELAPEGPVFVKGALWRGRAAEGRIDEGDRIRVRGVDGLILRVTQESSEEDPAPLGPDPASSG